LLIKYKPKHPKKGGYKEQNGRTHVQEIKRTIQEGKPQKEHQVIEPPYTTRSISNKEKGRAPKRTLRKTFTYYNNPSQNRDHLCPLKYH
jgi:hypothetical protein